ncbi:Caspase recruitment domain-containing protein 14 [Bienertia sinuspersici]
MLLCWHDHRVSDY